MSDGQLSFRKSANIDRVTDKRKDSLFRLVDTDGSGTIDAQEFAVLYDAIKKDLAEELEKEAQLQKEASSARRRFKMLLLFVAVLVSFLAASVAANFAVIFTVVDQAITTTTTSTGLLEVKGTDAIAKTATATQDVPLMAAPALDIETLSQVKSLKVTYRDGEDIQASMNVVAVRKHNATFVEFITDVDGETIEALNGVASFVRYPTMANQQNEPVKYEICSGNATCSAFRTSGIDADAAMAMATDALIEAGFLEESKRHLTWHVYTCSYANWKLIDICGWSWQTYSFLGPGCATVPGDSSSVQYGTVSKISMFYYTAVPANRNMVLILHGKGQTTDHVWPGICHGGSVGHDCPMLMKTEFQKLLFAAVSMNITDIGASSWAGTEGYSTAVDVSDFSDAVVNLAGIMCGFGSTDFDDCDFNDGYFADYVTTPKIMCLGYSDGAGFAMHLNYFHSHRFVLVHAMDNWAPFGAEDFLPAGYEPNDPPKIKAFIYTNCASGIFELGPALAIIKGPGHTSSAQHSARSLGSRSRSRDSASTGLGSQLVSLTYDMTYPKAGNIEQGVTWAPKSSGPVTYDYGNPGAGTTESFMLYEFWKTGCGSFIKFAVGQLDPGFTTLPGGDAGWYTNTACPLKYNQALINSAYGGNVHGSAIFWSAVFKDVTWFADSLSPTSRCQWAEDSSTQVARRRRLREEQVKFQSEVSQRRMLQEDTAVPLPEAKGDRRKLFEFPPELAQTKPLMKLNIDGTLQYSDAITAMMTSFGVPIPLAKEVPEGKQVPAYMLQAEMAEM